jgi:hypothetical protein
MKQPTRMLLSAGKSLPACSTNIVLLQALDSEQCRLHQASGTTNQLLLIHKRTAGTLSGDQTGWHACAPNGPASN